MPIERVLVQRLTSNAGLVALVGSRVYFATLPDKPVFPCVMIRRISDVSHYAMSGPACLNETLFQFDAFARTFEAMIDVRNAIKRAIERYQDDSTIPIISDCFIENEEDLELEDAEGSGQRMRVWQGCLDVMVKTVAVDIAERTGVGTGSVGVTGTGTGG